MEKLIFSLVLVLTAGIISLITGRNKRQLNRIPEGMAILCQPPGKRYVLYAMGVLVFLFVMFLRFFYHERSAGKCQVYVGTVRGNGSIAAVCYHIGG